MQRAFGADGAEAFTVVTRARHGRRLDDHEWRSVQATRVYKQQSEAALDPGSRVWPPAPGSTR
jgi:hypothetical protein